jgi:signal transduction histidine kinase
MSGLQSLSRRLAVASLLWLVLALGASGILLAEIFRNHAESVLADRLADDMDHIASAVEVLPDGTARVTRALPDSLYDRPYSGRYWQVEVAGAPPLRSRSLWDDTLPNPPDDLKPGEIHRHRFDGPAGQKLVAVERSIGLDGLDQPIRLVVASDEKEVAKALAEFRGVLALSLAVLGLGLAIAVALQIHFGLAPLQRLRRAVVALKGGNESALTESWPREVAPLVADLTDVLSRNRALVERARAEASNLAHALKTPLAVLRNAAGAGDDPLARTARAQAGAMQGHIERHLARARAGAAATQVGLRTDTRAIVLKLADTLGRLHPERAIRTALSGRIPSFAGSPDDLADIVGNLLDNALKWSRTTVRLSLAGTGTGIEIEIDDDGPGIAPEARAAVLRRGTRLDETKPGTGFGLAIADELAALYAGSLTLGDSDLGGLKVTVRLPAAA